jgi:isobutyryl-CoA mutase small subunit
MHLEIGMMQPGVLSGDDHLVQVAPDLDESGPAAGTGRCQLCQKPAAGPQLEQQRVTVTPTATRHRGSCPTLTDMAGNAPLRVVVAKPGLDGHDRGAKVVARALRDAGVEVIYTGLHQTPEQVVETAIQEDADAIGLSILSGAHMTLFRKVIDLLTERDARDITVFGGGIIPDADIPLLEQMGVAKIFTPGATTHDIVAWVHSTLEAQQPA